MKPSDVGIEGFLRHIYQETSFITTYLSTLTHEEYEQNRVSRYALVRSLEIIGEAAKHIPETYRSEHPEIPWKLLAGNRDTLIHGYFTIFSVSAICRRREGSSLLSCHCKAIA
ncbi:MAG TPA: DUF86 domain-containing protein [Methanocorpusculum sp.]|nr:DUF86 domain-containing protein [Methanocorpusculum sp.]HJK53418.1 DUF86 domain-containing protein [Methanocorpusculum sp.]